MRPTKLPTAAAVPVPILPTKRSLPLVRRFGQVDAKSGVAPRVLRIANVYTSQLLGTCARHARRNEDRLLERAEYNMLNPGHGDVGDCPIVKLCVSGLPECCPYCHARATLTAISTQEDLKSRMSICCVVLAKLFTEGSGWILFNEVACQFKHSRTGARLPQRTEKRS